MMAECKTCGKEYHACMSCGFMDWEYDYKYLKSIKNRMVERL